MPSACPACGSIIRHSQFEEMPRIGAQYRCHICRLELMMDDATKKLVVLPFEDTAKHASRKPSADE